MNKQKLLLLTFMQNDREGRSGMGLGPVTARQGWPPATQEITLPGLVQAPSGYMPPWVRACLPPAREVGSDALQPGLGAGMLCPRLWCSREPAPPHSNLGGAGCLSLSGVKAGEPTGLLPPSGHGCQCHLSRDHTTSVQETRRPRTAPPLPIPGPRISTSHTRGMNPWLPVPAGRGDRPEGKQEKD